MAIWGWFFVFDTREVSIRRSEGVWFSLVLLGRGVFVTVAFLFLEPPCVARGFHSVGRGYPWDSRDGNSGLEDLREKERGGKISYKEMYDRFWGASRFGQALVWGRLWLLGMG